MPDEELDLELEEDGAGQEKKLHPIDKRLAKALSDKEEATKEREKILKEKEKVETEKAALQKEVEFHKTFSTLASKYKNASEFQDKIREKFNAGYELEDATISILAKEGQLIMPEAPPPPKENPAGGSAANQIKSGEPKSISAMSQEEKLKALTEAEKRGDLGLS